MKVKGNQDACIGCGACAAVCDKVFEIGDEGFAQVKVEAVPEEENENVVAAMEGCPTSAISNAEEE